MLYKTLFLSIFIAVSFISSVENAEEIPCYYDDDFIDKAKQSINETVAIVVTNKNFGLQPFMKNNFADVVTKFLIIEIAKSSRNFTNFSKIFRPYSKPLLYIMHKGFILKTILNSNKPDDINKMIAAAQNPDAAEKMSERPITEGFEAFHSGKPAKVRKNIGSTSGSVEGSSSLGQKRDLELSPEEQPPTDNTRYQLFGTNLLSGDIDNSNKRRQPSGDDDTSTTNSIRLFGAQINKPSGGNQPPSPSLPPRGK